MLKMLLVFSDLLLFRPFYFLEKFLIILKLLRLNTELVFLDYLL